VDVAVVGDEVWVVEQDGRGVSSLDTATGEVLVRSEEIGTRPRGIGASDAGVWVVGVEPSAAVLVENRP
jgi:streptogramin lyase